MQAAGQMPRRESHSPGSLPPPHHQLLGMGLLLDGPGGEHRALQLGQRAAPPDRCLQLLERLVDLVAALGELPQHLVADPVDLPPARRPLPPAHPE